MTAPNSATGSLSLDTTSPSLYEFSLDRITRKAWQYLSIRDHGAIISHGISEASSLHSSSDSHVNPSLRFAFPTVFRVDLTIDKCTAAGTHYHSIAWIKSMEDWNGSPSIYSSLSKMMILFPFPQQVITLPQGLENSKVALKASHQRH